MFKIILLIFPLLVFGQAFQSIGPIQLKPFTDKSGFNFMPDAMECTFLKSTDGNYRETTCDYVVPFTIKMDGINFILQNNAWADYAYMTVHHPTGDVELARFGTKIYFDTQKQRQDWIKTNYDAELVAGLKIRIHYFTKNTANDIAGLINFSMHKVVP